MEACKEFHKMLYFSCQTKTPFHVSSYVHIQRNADPLYMHIRFLRAFLSAVPCSEAAEFVGSEHLFVIHCPVHLVEQALSVLRQRALEDKPVRGMV